MACVRGGGINGVKGRRRYSMYSTDVVGSNSLESLPRPFSAVSSIPTRKDQEEREDSLFEGESHLA